MDSPLAAAKNLPSSVPVEAMRSRIAVNASPPRPMTLSSMEWLTCMLDASGSGSASMSFSNDG